VSGESSAPRIAIAVQGRFYAFDLARALLQRGADVTLLTNYPRRVVGRFGVPAERVRTLVPHGVAARLADRLHISAEAALHTWFGRWTARQLAGQPWTVTYVFSGVAEEWLTSPNAAADCALARASVHIREQRRLLDQEEERVGVRLDKPSDWMIEREEREYERAGSIIVLSRFAFETFRQRGVPLDKLRVMSMPTDAPAFVASEAALRARIDRIQAHRRLRILYVGTISYRKGMYDLAQVIELLPADRFEFRLVGPILPECREIARRMSGRASLTGKIEHDALRGQYDWADVFLMPSIEDGFPIVLSQACAAGLPIIASTHGAGPDLVANGVPGWCIPPRAPETMIELLQEIDHHRAALVDRIWATRAALHARSWLDVADDFLNGARVSLESH
jgi:glycosyltransferase involved in cell wall biosynthesis